MNWTRTILDGLAMAAYFNLFAAAVALYRPRLMFPCYPPCLYCLTERESVCSFVTSQRSGTKRSQSAPGCREPMERMWWHLCHW